MWPARFDACIAVAGVNFDDAPLDGSCRGPDVDISAPAQNVYRASIGQPASGQGQGTSFAVALTAGVVACWLAHHGRAQIITEARRRGETVQAMAGAFGPRRGDPAATGTTQYGARASSMPRRILRADFDRGRETEGPLSPDVPVRTVRCAVSHWKRWATRESLPRRESRLCPIGPE